MKYLSFLKKIRYVLTTCFMLSFPIEGFFLLLSYSRFHALITTLAHNIEFRKLMTVMIKVLFPNSDITLVLAKTLTRHSFYPQLTMDYQHVLQVTFPCCTPNGGMQHGFSHPKTKEIRQHTKIAKVKKKEKKNNQLTLCLLMK